MLVEAIHSKASKQMKTRDESVVEAHNGCGDNKEVW